MGRQSRAKARRRDERRVRAALEQSGVAERVRMAFLGLRREDVQAGINEVFASGADWREKPALVQVARHELSRRGYDLEGVDVTVEVLPGPTVVHEGRLVTLPPIARFNADATVESIEAARVAAGARHAPQPRQVAAAN